MLGFQALGNLALGQFGPANYGVIVYESISVIDNFILLFNVFTTAVAESLTITDRIIGSNVITGLNVVDALTIIDTENAIAGRNVAAIDSVTISDREEAALGFYIDVRDTLTITDTDIVSRGQYSSVREILAATDTEAVQMKWAGLISEYALLVDIQQAVARLHVAQFEFLNPFDIIVPSGTFGSFIPVRINGMGWTNENKTFYTWLAIDIRTGNLVEVSEDQLGIKIPVSNA